jgi:carbonic anhydrase
MIFDCERISKSHFADIISANTKFVNGFQHSDLTGTARKGLAIITCMDSRISPLAVVGMQAGDVARIRSYPLLQKGDSVAGAIYNVSTGQLEPVDY